jgi:hypothetical protein
VRRIWPRAARTSTGRLVLALAVTLGLAPGCTAFRREPLDVPPGHQMVLGGVLITGFSLSQLMLDIARDDGGYQTELPVGDFRNEFVITLPRGRYQIIRLRGTDSGRIASRQFWFRVGATFEVGDSAVYIGTLQIARMLGNEVRVAVQDEYERAVPALRARYPELPPVVARAAMRTS